MKVKIAKHSSDGCDSAVTSTKPLTQQQARSSQHLCELKKQLPAREVRRYRASKTSATMRIPNELRGKVQALVDAYREQQIADPDTWK